MRLHPAHQAIGSAGFCCHSQARSQGAACEVFLEGLIMGYAILAGAFLGGVAIAGGLDGVLTVVNYAVYSTGWAFNSIGNALYGLSSWIS